MGRIGRPSEIYSTLREGRCAACGAWIRLGLLRTHYEVEHPRILPSEDEIAVREIPLVQRIPEIVESGVPLTAAAAACGIPSRTVERWMEWGAAQEEALGPEEKEEEIPENRRIFWRFRRAVTLAREAGKAHLLRSVARADDWRAQAWILERTHPSDFARIERLRVGGDREGGPIRVVHEEDDPNYVEEVARIYRDAGVLDGVDSRPSTNGTKPKED